MADRKWTEEQKKVIELRNRNLLVSAAAGSGKTAVLVERIISMVTDEQHPVDIDHLLVVTFTNAAASEMKERIADAIEKRLEIEQENRILQKQAVLARSAQITTIDSFCLNIIRNHFNQIDLDPGFRIAEEAELILIRSDVAEEILEECYAEGGEDFLHFIECYSTGKTDQGIEDMIFQIYRFADSYPNPEKWLEERKAELRAEDWECLEDAPWMETLRVYLKTVITDAYKKIQECIQICKRIGGPYHYEDTLQSDRELLEILLQASTYREYASVLRNIRFQELSRKRPKEVEAEYKEEVKNKRAEVKKVLLDLQKYYFFQSEEEMLEDMKKAGKTSGVLLDLTERFLIRFREKKEEKNLLDFSDIEHLAFHILVKPDETPSDTALELSQYYEEIMIDEYQDSSLLQEKILNSISRERNGNPNIFMVGDVKQSIYKFRLARPELFMKKYEAYTAKDSKYQKIDLHKNFRSRPLVLHCVNDIFKSIMRKELGGIEYNEDASLHPGAVFEECKEGIISEKAEIMLIEKGLGEREEEKEEILTEQELSSRELEAKAVVSKIKELTDTEKGIMVWGKEGYRKAEYGDIVILLRTMSGWSDVFTEVLMAESIPAAAETGSGYFSALEVQTVLNMLRVVDNPRQDIPLAAVLSSPIVGFQPEELARMRAGSRELELYDSLLAIVQGQEYDTKEAAITIEKEEEEKEQEKIRKKAIEFYEMLQKFRNKVFCTPVHDLILFILEETEYGLYVKAMPGGQRRSANLDMLIQKAVQFEKTSYHGLFHFIRYIERLHKYEVDFGEAGSFGENDNTVRIMSIHKSKGLEFPIVIVAGMAKTFNHQDTRSRIVLHPEIGMGADYVDASLRIKSPTLLKRVIQRKILLDNLGEELRILYVALTRAKEKLVLCGTVAKAEEKRMKWIAKGKKSSFSTLLSANCYLDWIMPVLGKESQNFSVSIVTLEDLTNMEMIEQMKRNVYKEQLVSWKTDEVFDEQIRKQIEEELGYQYPYWEATRVHAKVTVSELKRLMIPEEEAVEWIGEAIEKKENQSLEMTLENHTIPEFARNEVVTKGADRGTLYHRLMQKIHLDAMTLEGIQKEIKQLIEKRIMTEQEAACIRPDKILLFMCSFLADRMRIAEQNRCLYRERQFVIGIPAEELYPEIVFSETVLVQGIIDAYFEEEDGLVLIDYKTDYIKEGEEAELIARYRVQLSYYQRALKMASAKKVKEVYIYSFALNRAIRLPNG